MNEQSEALTKIHRITQRRTLLQWIKGYVWTYDYFISYHWGSGGQYAVTLAQRLRSRNIECFLDRTDFAAGDVWVEEGKAALRHSKKLILVGTPEALTDSDPVCIELEIFRSRSAQVIPICFGSKPQGVDSPSLNLIPKESIWLIEDRVDLNSGPSDHVIKEIARSTALLSSRATRGILMMSVIFVLLGALVLVAKFGVSAQKSAQEARLQTNIQLVRRLASDAASVGSERVQLGVLLATHGLNILEQYGEWLPDAEEVLREFLPKKIVSLPSEVGAKPATATLKYDDANNARYDKFSSVAITLRPQTESMWTISSSEFESPREIHLKSQDFPWDVAQEDATDKASFKTMGFRFSDDLNWMVTTAPFVHPELWDLTIPSPTGQQLPLIEFLLDTNVTFSSDSRWLAASSLYTGIIVLDLSLSSPTTSPYELTDHSELTNSIAFSSNSMLLASGSNDHTVCLYDVSGIRPKFVEQLRRDNATISHVVFSLDGRWLVSTDEEGRSIIWDTHAEPIQSSAVLVHTDSSPNAGQNNNYYFTEDLLLIGLEEGNAFSVIPLSRSRLRQEAATFSGRNLSHAEWDEFFQDREYEITFPQFNEGEGYPEVFDIF